MEQGKMKASQEAMQASLKVASEITDADDKSAAYREISKVLMEQGKMKASQEAMQASLKVASDITDAYGKSYAYIEISKILMEQGDKKESLRITAEIKTGLWRLQAFTDFGKQLAFREAQNMVPSIPSEENKMHL
jgi:ATP/maltotriose-dependent transcriptional regulator MalT